MAHLEKYEKLLDNECVEYCYLSDTPCPPGRERYNYLFRIIFFPAGFTRMTASYDGVLESRTMPVGSIVVGGKRNWSYLASHIHSSGSFSVVFMRDLTRLVFSQADSSGCWQTCYCHYPPPEGILAELLECADKVIADRKNDRHERVNALLKVILNQFRCDLNSQQDLGCDLSENVTRAIHYIELNYGSKINCSSVAEALQLNRTMLSGEFHKATGELMRDYILKLRLRKACWLLESSPLKIKRIAEVCGFDSPGAFIKIFRRKLDLTPQEWRKSRQ